MCDKVHKYKTQEMWDKAIGFNLIILKFVSDWFVTNKMLEKLDDYLFCNDDIFFHDADSNIITFLIDDINTKGFNTKGFHNINLDKNDFDDDDPETNSHVRLMTWHNRFKKEISKELMPVHDIQLDSGTGAFHKIRKKKIKK